MKKYNRIIVLSLALYLLLAVLLHNFFINMQDDYDHSYRVESNMIMSQLSDYNQIEDFDLSDYEYIKSLEFISYYQTNQDELDEFYLESNTDEMMILPFFDNDELQGYIKFIYRLPTFKINDIIIIAESCLLILEVFVIVILIYLKRKVILPFQRLNDLPLELAKGHLHSEVKEEKSRYFGKFMWGMSQLQDTLDVSKKRQLELMKEKKKMLLSLSHDMKTPLNLIKLYSKALQEDVYSNVQERNNAIKQINIKADEIEKYIETIISSSREDILELQVNNSEFYLADLIKRVLTNYQEQCKIRNVDLIIHDFENKLLQGDIERSQEVFDNIFENAFKYGDGRKIEISFYEEDYCQLIKIYNTGNQVSDTEFNHIFESFYRGVNSQGKRGNGLGLYICKELMGKMDGAIFASKEDEGMSFTLVFR